MNKKNVLLTFVLFLVGSLYLTAQDQIKTEVDSLSYSYGFVLAGQGLEEHMAQLGITRDNPDQMKSFLKGLSDALTQKAGDKSYLTGISVAAQIMMMSDNVKEQTGLESLNMELLDAGLKDALSKKSSIVNEPKAFFDSKIEKLNTHKFADAIKKSNQFLEQNKTKEGIVALPSGLQYKIIEKGNGEIPKESEKVKVHYKGRLIDGTQFDSSYDRGEPIVLGVAKVIKGWTEALLLMPVGSKWELYVPYNLGYGERDMPQIPAYSTLIFEIELLGIEK